MRARRSSNSSVELIAVTEKPRLATASTWSFMSEMSGEITSTVPFSSRAGS